MVSFPGQLAVRWSQKVPRTPFPTSQRDADALGDQPMEFGFPFQWESSPDCAVMGLGLDSGVWSPRGLGAMGCSLGLRRACAGWGRRPWGYAPSSAPPSWPRTGLAGQEVRGRQEPGGRGGWHGLCREPPGGTGRDFRLLNRREEYSWGNPWSRQLRLWDVHGSRKVCPSGLGRKWAGHPKTWVLGQLCLWLAMRRTRLFKDFLFWNNYKLTECCKNRTGRSLIPFSQFGYSLGNYSAMSQPANWHWYDGCAQFYAVLSHV